MFKTIFVSAPRERRLVLPFRRLATGAKVVAGAARRKLLDHMATAAAHVSPDVEAVPGRAPRDFAQWTSEHAQAFR